MICPEVEHRVGLFINPLPLHSRMREEQKVKRMVTEFTK